MRMRPPCFMTESGARTALATVKLLIEEAGCLWVGVCVLDIFCCVLQTAASFECGLFD